MDVNSLNDPVWVDTCQDLKRALNELRRYEIVAVDTESNSLHAYYERVCLIQFSCGRVDYVVDPLAIEDMSILGTFFADEKIEKVFHAAEYDIISLKRDFGFTFTNIFDTMIAGRVLGMPAVGLASMLEAEFDILLDKRYQRANWGKRPLPSNLLRYARLDVHYLIELRHRMLTKLDEAGRLDLAEEDFRRVCRVEIPQATHEENLCWRVAGQQQLAPHQAATLQELCLYRDQQARHANIPPFKILNNSVLLEVAMACPGSRDELTQISSLSLNNISRHADGLLHAVQRGMHARPPQRTSSPRPDDAYLGRVEALRKWRKETAQKLGVESDVVLPRDTIELIARHNPKNSEELAELMADLPVRFDQYGWQILQILPG